MNEDKPYEEMDSAERAAYWGNVAVDFCDALDALRQHIGAKVELAYLQGVEDTLNKPITEGETDDQND